MNWCQWGSIINADDNTCNHCRELIQCIYNIFNESLKLTTHIVIQWTVLKQNLNLSCIQINLNEYRWSTSLKVPPIDGIKGHALLPDLTLEPYIIHNYYYCCYYKKYGSNTLYNIRIYWSYVYKLWIPKQLKYRRIKKNVKIKNIYATRKIKIEIYGQEQTKEQDKNSIQAYRMTKRKNCTFLFTYFCLQVQTGNLPGLTRGAHWTLVSEVQHMYMYMYIVNRLQWLFRVLTLYTYNARSR